MDNPTDCLNAKDPLTRPIAILLINYAEEDDRVDYKLTVDIGSEKEWLGLTKDISAFANTYGGYLVFGVNDSDKLVVGLSRQVENVLKDVNNLQLKVNRHVEPDISKLRSKAFRIDGKSVVVLFIPASSNVTHIVSKNGVFPQQSGKPKTVLRQGTFYVRRSASNHLGDSRDLDDLVERRIDHFRDALLDKVARVVKSPADSNLFILSKDPEDVSGERFIIEDAPESIPVKGMSFTVSPQGDEEEIAAWSVLNSGNRRAIPPATTIWDWYSRRDEIQIRETHRLDIFQFSLWRSVPSFYWIQGTENSIIRKTLIDTIRTRPDNLSVTPCLVVASFLGKTTHKGALSALGGYADRVSGRHKRYPLSGPRAEFGTIRPAPKQTAAALKEEKIKELYTISDEVKERNKEPSAQKRWRAQDLDCFLYAQDNNYK